MTYAAYYTPPNADIRSGDSLAVEYTCTDELRAVAIGRQLVNERRDVWAAAHPGVTIRKGWFDFMMVVRLSDGAILWPLSARTATPRRP